MTAKWSNRYDGNESHYWEIYPGIPITIRRMHSERTFTLECWLCHKYLLAKTLKAAKYEALGYVQHKLDSVLREVLKSRKESRDAK